MTKEELAAKLLTRKDTKLRYDKRQVLPDLFRPSA